ncbi:hypothetical protein DSL72_004832 [Monilinia vaccinii-corymbosi]|uniref:Uncharacterized protein n=1 Tax=Monilinia vaccinii-corymbosi TaxID=61207 RepID=A0A8A3P1I3_9HELO|nr:hypothetical protein DSL72_004832 [Monilinia vaccinii-corymbosi]
MATVGLPLDSASNRPPRPRTRRPRRGGSRNAGPASADANTNTNVTPTAAAQVSEASLSLRPASVAPLPGTGSSNPSNPPNANGNNRGGHGRRGDGRSGGFGRGGRRGGPRGQTMANGRVFGGQLTGPASHAGSLPGDAPSFVPGQHIATQPGSSRVPRVRRMSKSQAPDLATRTHEDITNGQYELVGRFYIYHVLKSGRRTRYLRINSEQLKMENCHHRDNGDVPVAICPKKIYQYRTLVGVQRKLNHVQKLDCPRILVVRLVQRNALETVRIHVILSAMLDLAHPALIWGLHFLASAARRLFQEDA